jgi:hypothetical protein
MIPHNDLADDTFLPLIGVEYEINEFNSYPGRRGARTCHICFIAPTADTVIQPFWNERYAYVGNAPTSAAQVTFDPEQPIFERDYTPQFINEFVASMRARGFFVTYNHPVWSLETYNTYTSYKGFSAMEIYNNSANKLGVDCYSPSIYDDILRSGVFPLFAIAADDNHNKHSQESGAGDSGGGFVMIKADKLDYETVISALHRGDFYASTGPSIYELYVEDGFVHVKTSDVTEIVYSTAKRNSRAVFANVGETVNEAKFEIKDFDGYFRITATDCCGKKAHTSAYQVSDFI